MQKPAPPGPVAGGALRLGAVTVLFGPQRGRYPDGNSLLLTGPDERLLIDPSLGVVARRGKEKERPQVDRIVLSHCHEDHLAGAFLFPEARAHLHEADLPGWQSLDGFMAIYGIEDATLEATWRRLCVEQFHYAPRPDAESFADGAVFELGGNVRLRVIHLPGHTRGHSAFYLEPDDVLYLGDIDLTSFGPYYGDAWSDLEDFEQSLVRVREIEARHYATFHHIGVLDRNAFLARLDRFAAVIQSREERLLAFLSDAPRSLDEVAAHRFVYRPGDALATIPSVERRSMGLHIERLQRAGRVRETEPGKFLADGLA